MRLRLVLILFGILFVSACSQEDFNKDHIVYLEKLGVSPKNLDEVKTYKLDIPNEILSNYEANDITFLSEYLGKTVTHYVYELNEEDTDGYNLTAVIFEVEEEIIGSYGVLSSWTPGLFNLDDKERLINEQKIKQ